MAGGEDDDDEREATKNGQRIGKAAGWFRRSKVLEAMAKQKRRSSRNGQRENAGERSVAAHVRDRQRAVAEREASRLARPEKRAAPVLGHADRKKSAVSSTPFGFLAKPVAVSPEISNQEWCGPFSVARQMIAAREEARRKREEELAEDNTMNHPMDQIMEEFDMEKKRKAHPALQWKSSLKDTSATGNQSLYSKRQKRADVLHKGRAVPSLFQLCVHFLADNFEYVESLGDIDSSVRTEITKELVARNKMNGQSFATIAEKGIEALEMVDCSEVTQDELATKLRELLPNPTPTQTGLRYLALDQSGRCFGKRAVDAIKESADRSELFGLSIGGAYLLKDEDAAELVVATAETVSSLEFKACPLLGMSFCKSISSSFASSKGTLLELVLEDLPLSEEQVEALIAEKSAFSNLKSLALRRMTDGVNDTLVVKMLEMCGSTLEGLDLSDNHCLTDLTLDGIRRFGGGLRSLSLPGLKHLTAAGLEALFTFVTGMAPPPMLRRLDLSNCGHEAVTDDVVQLATQASSTKNATEDSAPQQQVTVLGGGLVSLNIQGSSLVTDVALEHVVATSKHTLEEINLSFCPLLTDQGLGYLVDQCGPQLSKISIWGNAQLTDTFLDGNRRVSDPSLEIVGAWMKNHASRTIR